MIHQSAIQTAVAMANEAAGVNVPQRRNADKKNDAGPMGIFHTFAKMHTPSHAPGDRAFRVPLFFLYLSLIIIRRITI